MATPAKEILDTEERPLCCTQWTEETIMVCVNHFEPPTESVMWRLSRDAAATFCYVNETVMVSEAEHWVDGTKEWRVSNNGEQSTSHLELRGELPKEFALIKNRYTELHDAKSNNEPAFEVPVDLFELIYDIRYGRGTGKQWQTLER